MYSSYGLIVLAMLLWGTGSIFTRLADQPALVIAFVRAAAAFLAAGAYFLLCRRRLNLEGKWRWALISGVFLSLNGFLFFKAVQSTAIGTAVLASNTAPIFYITWACLFLGERLERRTLLALPLAVAGIVLLMSGCEISLTSKDFTGILYGLGNALAYSFVVLIAKGMPQIPTASMILVQMGVGVVMFGPLALSLQPAVGAVSLAAMTTLGLVHSCLCLAIYFTALKKVKVQHAGILGYIDPASAILYAYLVFGEIPTVTTALGGLCILAAGALAVVRFGGSAKTGESAQSD